MFIIKTQDKYVDLSRGWIKKVEEEEKATQFQTREEVRIEVDKMKGYGFSDIKIEKI